MGADRVLPAYPQCTRGGLCPAAPDCSRRIRGFPQRRSHRQRRQLDHRGRVPSRAQAAQKRVGRARRQSRSGQWQRPSCGGERRSAVMGQHLWCVAEFLVLERRTPRRRGLADKGCEPTGHLAASTARPARQDGRIRLGRYAAGRCNRRLSRWHRHRSASRRPESAFSGGRKPSVQAALQPSRSIRRPLQYRLDRRSDRVERHCPGGSVEPASNQRGAGPDPGQKRRRVRPEYPARLRRPSKQRPVWVERGGRAARH